MCPLSRARDGGRLLVIALAGWLAACNHDTSDAGPRAAAAVAAIALQSDEFKAQRIAQALPVELEHRLLPPAGAGRPVQLELLLHTELAAGVLEVSIAAPPGAIAGDAMRQRFDLARAARPLRIVLELAPAGHAAVPRTLVIEVAARQGSGRQTRVFRIVVPAPMPAPQNPH